MMPETWTERLLQEVTLKIGSGATPRGGKEVYKGQGIVFIRSMNVYDLRFAPDNLAYIDEDQAAQLDNVIVQEGDVLLNITGASVARCCYAPRYVLPARVNQHVAILRPNPSELSGKFLTYLLTSPSHKDKLLSHAQVGATREALTKGGLENFTVVIPPLPTQRRIASVLSAYDDLIENNTRRIAILEEMARRLYEEWFVKFRFPGHEDPEGSHELPKRWEIVTLDKLMGFQGGAQPPKDEWISELRDGYVRMIQIRDYTSDAYISYVKETKRTNRTKPLDIMIARYGASVGRICWGLSGTYNVALVKVEPTKPHLREYLRSALSSEMLQSLIIGMSGRAAQAGFNKSILQSISLPHPDDELLIEHERIVGQFRQEILLLRAKNTNLRAQRDLLLPKLISGEIDVSNLPLPGTEDQAA